MNGLLLRFFVIALFFYSLQEINAMVPSTHPPQPLASHPQRPDLSSNLIAQLKKNFTGRVNQEDIDEQYCLDYCLANPSYQTPRLGYTILHILIKTHSCFHDISRLIHYYHTYMPEQVIQALSCYNFEGFTPLHLAAFRSNLYGFALLLLIGANIEEYRIFNNQPEHTLITALKGIGKHSHTQNRYFGIIDLISSRYSLLGLKERCKAQLISYRYGIKPKEKYAPCIIWFDANLSPYSICGRCYITITKNNTYCSSCGWHLVFQRNIDSEIRTFLQQTPQTPAHDDSSEESADVIEHPMRSHCTCNSRGQYVFS